jgi:hypothetical protein
MFNHLSSHGCSHFTSPSRLGFYFDCFFDVLFWLIVYSVKLESELKYNCILNEFNHLSPYGCSQFYFGWAFVLTAR